jgi:excinuclease UvrABC helicase subunit UvrB
VIIIASVSAIYGLGDPESRQAWQNFTLVDDLTYAQMQ